MISRTKREAARGRRGASRTAKSIIPGLARWAGAGVFVGALMMACDGDSGAGPTPPDPNPNEPYPLWLTSVARWSKYDRNGNVILSVEQMPRAVALGVNPSTGEIWASAEGLSIYGPNGKFEKKAELSGVRPLEPVIFDTRRSVAWVCYYPEVYDNRLAQFDFDGKHLKDIVLPEQITRFEDMDVHEASGSLWFLSPYRVYKLNERGEVLFAKTDDDLDYKCDGFCSLAVDQTDGGVWLRGMKGSVTMPYILKIDKDAKRVREMYGSRIVFYDVNRKNGDILVGKDAGDNRVLYLHDKAGGLLWQSEPMKSFKDAKINDFDGSVWFAYYQRPPVYELSRIKRNGEYAVRDVPTDRERFSEFRLHVKLDPYPYE